MTGQPTMDTPSRVGKAEHHAILIGKAISEARAAGVNVTLDWGEDEDGMHVEMYTTVHRRGDDGVMRWVEGPFIVEGY